MTYPFKNEGQKNLLMTLLKLLGGHKAQVTFDGSGDSGSIDYVGLLDRNGNEINLEGATFDWYEQTSNFDHTKSKWDYQTRPVPNMPLADVLKNICEEALEEANLDWYNNEGGYGSLNIDLSTTPPTITMDVHIRIIETEDHEFDFTHSREEVVADTKEQGGK